MFEGIKSKILHGKTHIREETKELKEGIRLFKAREKKEELRAIIEDMGF